MRPILPTLLLLALATGCGEGVTVVEVPRAYVLPDRWSLDPGQDQATLSFRIEGEAGGQGEVSILAMPSLALGDAEFVNLWRSRMQLPEVGPEEAGSMASEIPIGSGKGRLYQLLRSGLDPDIGTNVLAARLQDSRNTWFFKFSGPPPLIERERPAFLGFLESLRLDLLDKLLRERRMAQRQPDPPPLPQWQAPSHWRSVSPQSSMVQAVWRIDGQDGGGADLTASRLSGDGGGLLANINRWRGQIGLEPVEDPGSVSSPLESGGILVDLEGEQSRILAAVVRDGDATWFYKLMGDPGLVGEEKEAFRLFVESAAR